MKAQELLDFGFKKITIDHAVYYELRKGRHHFLTNDAYSPSGRNINKRHRFFVGYDNTKNNEDTFWFNEKLDSMETFITVYQLLVY